MNNPHPPTIELVYQDWAERIPNPQHIAWQEGYEARGKDDYQAGFVIVEGEGVEIEDISLTKAQAIQVHRAVAEKDWCINGDCPCYTQGQEDVANKTHEY